MIFGFLSNPTRDTKEINSTFLYDSLLENREIEKIVVVNEKLALIYIKKELLKDNRHNEVTDGIFGLKTDAHYNMPIESIETFKDKLKTIQQEFELDDRVEIQYENRIDWSKLFSWILPIAGIVILFWLLWPKIKRKL
ncbi:MAG: hypothetical protein R2783_02765 [Gelidibacter sp.]